MISTRSNLCNNEFSIIKYNNKCSLMHLYSLVNWFTTSSESPFITTPFSPKSSRILRSAIKASYSVSLLEQWPSILNLNFIEIPFDEMIKIPILVPLLWFEPSKYNSHGSKSKWFYAVSTITWSTIKSTTIYLFMSFKGPYVKEYSVRAKAHFPIYYENGSWKHMLNNVKMWINVNIN